MRTSEAPQSRTSPQSSIPATTPAPLRARARRRVLSAFGMVAAVLAISLIIVALLASHSLNPPITGNQSPTLTVTPGQGWKAAPYLTGLPGLPVIAPSDPPVVYEAVQNGQWALQRSDDGGATWQSLPLPDGAPQGNGAVALLFVNPLNAQQVYLEINADCSTAQVGGIGPAVALSAGGCTFDYVSTDAGAHWQQAQWPVSASNLHKTRLGAFYDYPAFKVQGTRLYALLSVGDGIGSILITSADGGVSWQPADQPLRAQANCATSFAPMPTGSTVFAITADHCAYKNVAALTNAGGANNLALPLAGGGGNTLWRSDDAGAHWSKVGGIFAGSNLRAVQVAGVAQPVLYDDEFLAADNTVARSLIKASVDGGHSWQPAPAGPAPSLYSDDEGILATLSDGSIVSEFGGGFYAWKVGQPDWHKVAPEIFEAPKVGAGPVMHLLVTTQGAGANVIFWAVIAKSSGYAVYSYQ